MKTLRLTRAESAAYANGERRFWRKVKPQPKDLLSPWPKANSCVCWEDFTMPQEQHYWISSFCPYGKLGDRIELAENQGGRLATISITTITAITVERRAGKWGWLVEVGA